MTQQSSTASTTADKASQTSAGNQHSRVGGESKYGFPTLPLLSADGSNDPSLFASFTRNDEAHLDKAMADAKETFEGWYEGGGSKK